MRFKLALKFAIILPLLTAAPGVLAQEASDAHRDTVIDDPGTHGVRADHRIEDAINDDIAKDAELKRDTQDLKVVSTQGSIILKGTVASPVEKMRLEIIARKQSTTKLVENDLEVRGSVVQ